MRVRRLCGIGVVFRTVGRRVFADSKQRWIVGDAAERLPKQAVDNNSHRLAAAQALAVKRADNVIG